MINTIAEMHLSYQSIPICFIQILKSLPAEYPMPCNNINTQSTHFLGSLGSPNHTPSCINHVLNNHYSSFINLSSNLNPFNSFPTTFIIAFCLASKSQPA